MILSDTIQLFRNNRKLAVQVERPYADFVTAHLILIVRLNGFIGFGIQEHARYLMRFLSKFGVFVLHIGKYLIQVARMKDKVEYFAHN